MTVLDGVGLLRIGLSPARVHETYVVLVGGELQPGQYQSYAAAEKEWRRLKYLKTMEYRPWPTATPIALTPA